MESVMEFVCGVPSELAWMKVEVVCEIVLMAALVMTTAFYAWKTKKMADSMREQRIVAERQEEATKRGELVVERVEWRRTQRLDLPNETVLDLCVKVANKGEGAVGEDGHELWVDGELSEERMLAPFWLRPGSTGHLVFTVRLPFPAASNETEEHQIRWRTLYKSVEMFHSSEVAEAQVTIRLHVRQELPTEWTPVPESCLDVQLSPS